MTKSPSVRSGYLSPCLVGKYSWLFDVASLVNKSSPNQYEIFLGKAIVYVARASFFK